MPSIVPAALFGILQKHPDGFTLIGIEPVQRTPDTGIRFFENESFPLQQLDRILDLVDFPLDPFLPYPPLRDAFDGILRLWIRIQVAKDGAGDLLLLGHLEPFTYLASSCRA